MKAIFFLVSVSVVLLLIACTHPRNDYKPNATVLQFQTPPPLERYRLQSGDTLDIRFFFQPELNQRVTVRPDGRITLQLVGEVIAVGQAPDDLATFLEERYSRELREPKITVTVHEAVGQRIYVGGEVNGPGLLPLSGTVTALQAIMQAGGPTKAGELESVLIMRDQGTPEPLLLLLDIKAAMSDPTHKEDLVLQAADVVFVPKTRITEANEFVEQYFDKLVPFNRNVGASYIIGGFKP